MKLAAKLLPVTLVLVLCTLAGLVSWNLFGLAQEVVEGATLRVFLKEEADLRQVRDQLSRIKHIEAVTVMSPAELHQILEGWDLDFLPTVLEVTVRPEQSRAVLSAVEDLPAVDYAAAQEEVLTALALVYKWLYGLGWGVLFLTGFAAAFVMPRLPGPRWTQVVFACGAGLLTGLITFGVYWAFRNLTGIGQLLPLRNLSLIEISLATIGGGLALGIAALLRAGRRPTCGI